MTEMFAIVDRTRLEIGGADRAKFLHNLCTNDVKSLAPGQGCEAFFTNVQGKLLGHVFLFVGAEAIVVDTVSGQAPSLTTHLERYHIREDVLIRDCGDEWSQVWLLGQEASQLLASLIEPADAAMLPQSRLAHATFSIAGVETTVASAGWGKGFWISCPRGDSVRLTAALSSAGASTQSLDALESARVEAGFPEWGRDINDKNLPQEVDRDALAISFKKGCYLGQETVARIDALGHVNRLLRRVRLNGVSPVSDGLELFLGDKPAGVVTSSAPSTHNRETFALTMLRREASTPGQVLISSLGEATVLAGS